MVLKFVALILSLLFVSPQIHAPIEQPKIVASEDTLNIFIEGASSTFQPLIEDLTKNFAKIGISVNFIDKDVKPYDWRIILTSDTGSGSGSCTVDISSCSASVSIFFASAVVLTPEGKLQFTETAFSAKGLAMKLFKMRIVLLSAKQMPSKKQPDTFQESSNQNLQYNSNQLLLSTDIRAEKAKYVLKSE